METSVAHTTITNLDDQPATPIDTGHHTRPTELPPATTPRRSSGRSFAAGMVAIAAAVGVAVLATTSADATPVATVVERDAGIELDVHGIPTWWSQQGGAPRQRVGTELDVHGIPAWWSERAPAP